MELPIVCPAGAPVNSERGPAVRCRIERTVIDVPRDPRIAHSAAFCCGGSLDRVGFADCPTWRAAKEAAWEGRAAAMERDVLAGVRAEEE